jgi:hypothetical protein
MPSSGILHHVALVITDVSEYRILHSVRRLLVTANVVPNSQILVTLMMEATRSSETSILTRATLRDIPKDGILHSDRRENLKSCTAEKYFEYVSQDGPLARIITNVTAQCQNRQL